MRETLNKQKLEQSNLFDEIEELPLDKLAQHGYMVFQTELFDSFVTDGVLVRDRSSYVFINASYLIAAKPTQWEFGMIPGDYTVSLFLTPGTLDNEEKVDEIIEKAQFYMDTDMTLLQYPAIFALK